MSPARRLLLAATTLLFVVLTPTGLAHADPAAPTDYRTEIVSVSPQIVGLEVSIEGGDSFVRLRAPDGAEVIVLGYANEPYLRIAEDGTVYQNILSAATYENENRYGGAEVPAFVDFRAPPEWEQIGGGGVWSWHDHRSHWMDDEPLIGLDPGESLPPQLIPITVDGRQVGILVETTLYDDPSPWPAVLGAFVGLQLVLLGWYVGPATATLTTLLVSLGALLAGGGQYLSLPPETDPRLVWWAMPAVAVICGVVAIATYGRSDWLVRVLLAVAGAQLLVWGFIRRDTLTKPILPTDIAFWFDRAATAAALVGGAAITALALWSLLAPPKLSEAGDDPTVAPAA